MKILLILLISSLGYTIAKDDSKLLRDLFKQYSERVYGKEYEKVKSMYDESAVTAICYHIMKISVEKGKKAYYGPEEIINAIKNYHKDLGDGSKTVNYNEKFLQLSDSFLYYYSDYKTQLTDRQLEGSYWQIWKKDKNGDWKILHDEFSIDN
ncbi:hypothetical protein WR25_01995 [Diploscapter pachys]|uniref:DUF4440 domain-containing protein n=1 Tax=Diploscapter pachys TaxID=2018661 RepID=A0A2A2L456_9BILA|nr:hypothetical protein WR25_01995 [Diploscapter pachys]